MFSVIFQTIEDMFLGPKYFLKSLIATAVFLLLGMGISNFDAGILIIVIATGVILLVRLLLYELIGKTKTTQTIFSVIIYGGVILALAYLIFNFDIEFFKKNFAKFVKGFIDMLEAIRRIYRILFG